jgi:hypothetical protein
LLGTCRLAKLPPAYGNGSFKEPSPTPDSGNSYGHPACRASTATLDLLIADSGATQFGQTILDQLAQRDPPKTVRMNPAPQLMCITSAATPLSATHACRSWTANASPHVMHANT